MGPASESLPSKPDKKEDFVAGINGGLKADKNKLDWTMFPWDAAEKVMEIMEFGKKKYARDNWKDVEPWRFKASLIRHAIKVIAGVEKDEDSGLLPEAHLACVALFILYLKLKKLGLIKYD